MDCEVNRLKDSMQTTYSGRCHGKQAELGCLDVLALGCRAVLENPPPNHADDPVEDVGILTCQFDAVRHVCLHAHLPEIALVHSAIRTGMLAETLDAGKKASMDRN